MSRGCIYRLNFLSTLAVYIYLFLYHLSHIEYLFLTMFHRHTYPLSLWYDDAYTCWCLPFISFYFILYLIFFVVFILYCFILFIVAILFYFYLFYDRLQFPFKLSSMIDFLAVIPSFIVIFTSESDLQAERNFIFFRWAILINIVAVLVEHYIGSTTSNASSSNNNNERLGHIENHT